jgi:hypothetical protein
VAKINKIIVGTGAAAAAGLASIAVYSSPVKGLAEKFPELPGAAVGAAGLVLADQKGEVGAAGEVMAYVGFSLALIAAARRFGILKTAARTVSGIATGSGASGAGEYFDPTAPTSQRMTGVIPVSASRTYNVPGRYV